MTPEQWEWARRVQAEMQQIKAGTYRGDRMELLRLKDGKIVELRLKPDGTITCSIH